MAVSGHFGARLIGSPVSQSGIHSTPRRQPFSAIIRSVCLPELDGEGSFGAVGSGGSIGRDWRIVGGTLPDVDDIKLRPHSSHRLTDEQI